MPAVPVRVVKVLQCKDHQILLRRLAQHSHATYLMTLKALNMLKLGAFTVALSNNTKNTLSKISG